MWHIQYECIQSIAWIHLVQILQWWEFGVVVGEAGKQGLECVLICSKVFMSILCIPCLLAALVACLTKVRNSVWWKLSICSHFWQILSFWALLSWHSKCYETLWKEHSAAVKIHPVSYILKTLMYNALSPWEGLV